MKTLGIVAEYNPFHYGHKYQLEASAKSSLADVVVVALSGNYVQRGELAICDKWMRALMALKNGADLVVEIPTYFCLSNAGSYARAGIEIFKNMGAIDEIAFGSESGDICLIRRAAQILDDENDHIIDIINKYKSKGFSYPRARQKAIEQITKSDNFSEILSSPNDTLGMEYLRNWSDKPATCIKRNDISAKEIRESILNGNYRSKTLPKNVEEILFRDINPLKYGKFLTERENKVFEIARYIIIKEETEYLEEMPQAGEGLSNRLKKSALKAKNLNELIEFTKSKRYTYSRISRLIYQILLGMNRDDEKRLEYIRILGFNDRGKSLLFNIKKNKTNSLPIVTNINKFYQKELFDSEIKATNLYNVLNELDLARNHELRKNIEIL